jgi:L-lysine 6-transaminase
MADGAFLERLHRVAAFKPANSDLYTVELAEFVETFVGNVTPEGFEHHFWVDGGALAVENAMKTAFDYKARRLGRTDYHANCNDLSILHFNQAFHGRSGYTMSVTNTIPDKVGLFPKFDWPRVHNPFIEFDNEGGIANDVEAEEAKSIEQIKDAFASTSKFHNRIAGILIEPMQGEGGDNHFRPEFMQSLRDLADENDALLLFDEVQTGFFGSGKPWFWQHAGVAPDVVSFGKKSQVCGIYAGPRVDEVADNVFTCSSRINSTWGGNLVDMVRATRIIEIICQDQLADRVLATGERMKSGLRALASERGEISSVRGTGSLIAFCCTDDAARSVLLGRLTKAGVLALPCGTRSVRFRLPLIITDAEVDQIVSLLADCLTSAMA